jgi:hypothetical protein
MRHLVFLEEEAKENTSPTGMCDKSPVGRVLARAGGGCVAEQFCTMKGAKKQGGY